MHSLCYASLEYMRDEGYNTGDTTLEGDVTEDGLFDWRHSRRC